MADLMVIILIGLEKIHLSRCAEKIVALATAADFIDRITAG